MTNSSAGSFLFEGIFPKRVVARFDSEERTSDAGASLLGAIDRKTKLTEKTYPAILKALQELPVETHWKEIPWRPNLGEAIEEARKEDKPILLWIMNGHPCGMT